MGTGCGNAVSDAWAAAVVQLASATHAGANQTHLAELLSNREGNVSLRSDNTILTAGLLTENLQQGTPTGDNRRNFTINCP